MSNLFNIGIATIFAREVLEGSIIVVNYRSIIHKNDEWSEERKKESLRTVTVAALIATIVAGLLVIAVAIPLGILGRDLDEHIVASVEGSSKLIATLFILQFSLKIPVWLGVYEKVPLCGLKTWIKSTLCGKKECSPKEEHDNHLDTLTLGEIRFNVMWNLWREVAECGVFLIPFFVGTGAEAIPISGIVGIIVALLLAFLIYQANNRMNNKCWLAAFMAGLTLMLSVGLLIGAISEFQELAHGAEEEEEEEADGDEYVYVVKNKFWADDKFPMVLIQPFGYSDKRTVLQICFFWLYLAFGLSMHYVMYFRTQSVRALRQQEDGSKVSKDTDEEEGHETSSDEEGGARTPVDSDQEDATPAPSESC